MAAAIIEKIKINELFIIIIKSVGVSPKDKISNKRRIQINIRRKEVDI